MSTTFAKKETVQRKWYVIDAAGKPLGRVAVQRRHPAARQAQARPLHPER